jgi:hypothetical protein
MGATERRKGVRGEHEVAELYRSRGFTIRGLEGAGDHLVVCGENSGVLLHSEVKRQEVARPWLWWEQASSEAPAGAIAAVHFRRNRSPWLALLAAGELVGLLEQLENSRAASAVLHDRVAELECRLEALGEPVA